MVSLDLAYAETKAALLDDLRTSGDSCWERMVPATPDWRVRDVVAHVTGIAGDAGRGTMPADFNILEQFRDDDVAAARDRYAEDHVTRRLGMAPWDIVAEWDTIEPGVLARLAPDCPDDQRLPFGLDAVINIDVCVHADDVAGALGLPAHPGSAAAGIALAGYCFGVDYRVRSLSLPAFAVRYGSRERVLGEGPAATTLTGDRWELLRAFAGRRSRSQIRAMDWVGDPDPYLALIPAYGERDGDLIEVGMS
jgi:uncharacterized protein (TIGR03083 family)